MFENIICRCGKSFINESARKPQKYCSDACRKAAHRIKSGRNEKFEPQKIKPVSCKRCGSIYCNPTEENNEIFVYCHECEATGKRFQQKNNTNIMLVEMAAIRHWNESQQQ